MRTLRDRLGPAGREYTLERSTLVRRTPEHTFSFFADARKLEAITPPWLHFRILEAPPDLGRGSLLRYRLSLFRVPLSWRTVIADWQPPRSFTDVQIAGPYRLWEHTHRFTAVPGGTEIYDHVRYRLPGGPLAPLLQRIAVERWLAEIFDYRSERIRQLI